MKKVFFWAFVIIIGVGAFGNSFPSSTAVQGTQTAVTPTLEATATLAPTVTHTPTPTIHIAPTSTPTQSSGLSNDNHYTNVDGNEVHSPAYSNTVPAGASAICGDGTYSFSQNRRGTCSHHGGVAQWL